MQAVLINFKPKNCEKIIIGEQTIEIRKTIPKLRCPFKCFIYATKSKRDIIGNITSYKFLSGISIATGKVIGEFICDKIDTYLENEPIPKNVIKESFLSNALNYIKNKRIYAWHISQVKFYDNPKDLSEFERCTKESMQCKYKKVVTDWNGYRKRYCLKFDKAYTHWCEYNYLCDLDCCEEYEPKNQTIKTQPKTWCYVYI